MCNSILKRFFYFASFIFLFSSCSNNTNYIRRMQAFEEGIENPTTIDELKTAISKYQDRIEDIILAQEQTGLWYKILATRYIDKGMYAQALEALQMAINTFPSNPNLFYYAGVCAGFMSKASLDYPNYPEKSVFKNMTRDSYLKLAESAYLRAIELQDNYSRALYGLSVLYVFETNESEKAIPYLEKFLTLQKKDIDGMFVLARAYFEQGEYERACELYDRIIGTTTLEQKKQEALQNKQTVLDLSYGANSSRKKN